MRNYTPEQYLARLRRFLKNLPVDELEDVMNYYAEYLYEAGPANYTAVMQRLGDPKHLAAGIKADFAMRGVHKRKPSIKAGANAVLLATKSIIGIPIVGIVSIVALFTVFVVLASLFIAAVVMVITGVVVAVLSALLLIYDLSVGLFYAGSALIAVSIGALLFMLLVFATRKLFKAMAHINNSIRYRRLARRGERMAKANPYVDVKMDEPPSWRPPPEAAHWGPSWNPESNTGQTAGQETPAARQQTPGDIPLTPEGMSAMQTEQAPQTPQTPQAEQVPNVNDPFRSGRSPGETLTPAPEGFGGYAVDIDPPAPDAGGDGDVEGGEAK
jgi:uncharacterized membrane protein